ncbi:glycoside hydrolase family 18 protein [Nocardioides sp. W7]|uniref:glycoside hydrolase family 18 protein n=1 Tax=Nocardioides sp. W7 TaxID=2931390 RepID=UPI001FD392D0|nr:glycoside hydrolase family 18 protein [Nocardioides sp. W7]
MRTTSLPALIAATALGAGLLTTVPTASGTAAPQPPAPGAATATESITESTADAASADGVATRAVTSAVLVEGESTSIAGKARKRVPVQLQRRSGKRWVKVAQRRTDRKRRYVFAITAPEATTTYRVKATRGRWSSAKRVVRVTAQTGSLTAPATTQPKTVLPVSADFAPARPGRPVRLEARIAGGAWTAAGSGVQDARGGVAFTVEPAATTSYRAVTDAWRGATATTSTTATVEVQRAAGRTPWVTGYYAGWFWEGHYGPTDVDFDAMTHLVLGRVTPGGGDVFGGEPGDIVEAGGQTFHEPSPWSPYKPDSVEEWMVDEAHRHGTEALLMLGGDAEAGMGFVASSADDVRADFVRNLVDYLVEHDYDGVDVDWENCFGGLAWECGIDITEDEAVRRLLALLLEIRAEMATRPRYATDPGIITFPGYALNLNWLEPGDKAKQWQADVANRVDQFNLMSYGIGTTWNKDGWSSWFSGALDGASRENGTPISIHSSIEAYVRTGVPRSRLGMGIGFYGIYFGPLITGPRQPTWADPELERPANEIYETNDVALAYSELKEMGYLDHGRLGWDEAAKSSYISYLDEPDLYGGYVPASDPARNPAGFLSFEDERSIAAKGKYARETGLGGTILWVLNYGGLPDGSNPLLAAVKRSFLGR